MADSPAEKVQHPTTASGGKRHAKAKGLTTSKYGQDIAAIGQVLRSKRQILPDAASESLACRLLHQTPANEGPPPAGLSLGLSLAIFSACSAFWGVCPAGTTIGF
jgi:hypothetical protein